MGIFVRVAVTAPLNPEFSSKAIMWATKYDASHMVIIYDEKIHHCDDSGVESMPLDEFLKTRKIIRQTTVDLDVDESHFYGYMNALDKTKYSYRSWPGFTLHVLRPFLADGKASMVCSEFVITALCDMSSRVRKCFEGMRLDFVNPREGFNILTSCP